MRSDIIKKNWNLTHSSEDYGIFPRALYTLTKNNLSKSLKAKKQTNKKNKTIKSTEFRAGMNPRNHLIETAFLDEKTDNQMTWPRSESLFKGRPGNESQVTALPAHCS